MAQPPSVEAVKHSKNVEVVEAAKAFERYWSSRSILSIRRVLKQSKQGADAADDTEVDRGVAEVSCGRSRMLRRSRRSPRAWS